MGEHARLARISDRLRAFARMPSPWLFSLLLALYCLTLSGDFMISDGEVLFQTTVALADKRTLALECNPGLPQIVQGVGGQCFSKYGLGTPLLSTLPYKFGRVLSRLTVLGPDPIAMGHFFVSFANLVITAATGLVLYWFARDLYRSRWLGLILALLYGVTTSAWPYSKVLFSEPLIALLSLLAAYAIFHLRAPGRAGLGWAALAGTALGYAMLTKVATVIVLPLFGLYLLWRLLERPWLREEPAPPATTPPPSPLTAASNFIRIGPRLAARQALRRPSRRVDPEAINRFPVPLRTAARPAATTPLATTPAAAVAAPVPQAVRLAGRALMTRVVAPLAAFAAPVAVCLALLLWHNAVRFGSPFDSGYSDEGFTTPFYVGVYGFLLSPGKSIFLYSPVVLLSIPAVSWLWRRRPAEALLAGSVFLVTLVYYASWWAWYGGWGWGPRFLVPTLPFLILPLGALLLERRWARWTVVLLAVAGIGVQVLGALIDFNPYIIEIVANDPANEAKYLFYPWLSPLIGHLRYLIKGQHLAVATFDMTRLGFSPQVALLFPILVLGTLGVSAAALVTLFRPQVRRLRGGGR